MSNLQSILENVDTPELLCQSVKCILQVARCYPHVFSINFRVSVLAVTSRLAIPTYPLERRSQVTLAKRAGVFEHIEQPRHHRAPLTQIGIAYVD